MAHCQASLKISCKSVEKFSRKVANRQTNRQRDRQTNSDDSGGKNNKSSAVAEMGDRLATIDMGQKVGGMGAAVPLSAEAGAPHLTQYGLGR